MSNDSSLKKANDLFKKKKYHEAKAIYSSILENKSDPIKKQIKFNIELTEKKIRELTLLRVRNINQVKNRSLKAQNLCINDKVIVGIASIPLREKALAHTINSLIQQVDRICVFLDEYKSVPGFLKDNEKITYITSDQFSKKIGDAGKFFWVDRFSGFYFTCDDDLIYPDNYIQRIKSKIIDHKAPIVVGWHGSVVRTPFANYYNSKSRRVFTFGAPRPHDTPVHILGTGCLGFHTSHIKVSFNDFPTPNMADVYFAKLGQEQQIPFVVIKHSRNEIKEYPDSNQVSIYMHSRSDTKGSHHNTKIMQNMIVKSLNWQIHYPKKFLRILVIGRFKTNEKGGIFKSSYLLSKNLSSLGHKVETCCLTELNQFDFGLNCFDFSIIYAPDPGRPDFANCIDKVKHLNRLGVVCAVNFSFNLNIERTQWIREQLDELNEEYKKPQCFFASFSNASAILLGDKYRDRVVTFPKTIFLKQSMSLNPSYTEREGIFLGDIAKLGDKTLTQGDAVKWIEQIRKELPHVNIYALKHYHSEIRLPGYIQVLPYTGEIEKMLVRFRLCVNLTPGATFEMIPLEAMLSGTPVIHRRMPQSLSEYLSPNSIEVDSAHELGEVCKRLYENKVLWKKLNRAGFGAYDFFRVENVISALELSIRKCLIRAGKKEIE